MATFNVCDFGAIGDGITNDSRAIQKALDLCHDSGGGTVIIPAPKTFLTGTVTMRSNTHLLVEGGARLLSAENREDFPNEDLRCMVEARNAENIAITGFGIIDGRAKHFMAEDLTYIYKPRDYRWRPRLIGLIGCKNVTFRDIRLVDAANWCLHMTGCENVVINGIRILNDLKVPNCDGIDPDHCKNVHISDCHIEAGDDCIVIKNTREFVQYGPTENITVNNCTLISTSAALKIGTESVDDFRNIVFNGCTIQSSSRGLAIQLRDQGNVENVIFSNMIVETRLFEDHWWGKAEPIYVTAVHRFGEDAPASELPAWNPQGKLGTIKHVRFSNIICRSENGAFIAGSKDCPIEDVVLDNVRIEVDKWSKWPGGKHDRRPCDKLGPAFRDPSKDPGLTDHPTSGVFIQNARDITLRNTKVVWGKNRPEYFHHALHAKNTKDLCLDGFTGESAHPEKHPAQLLENSATI